VSIVQKLVVKLSNTENNIIEVIREFDNKFLNDGHSFAWGTFRGI
jgi:hypothetical protein